MQLPLLCLEGVNGQTLGGGIRGPGAICQALGVGSTVVSAAQPLGRFQYPSA